MLHHHFYPLLLALLANLVLAALHPAKRQLSSIGDVCGSNPVDCGNGWCCLVGQECVDASPEPLCRDNSFTGLGLYVPTFHPRPSLNSSSDGFTNPAFPYSSLINALSSLDAIGSSLDSELRTGGITVPTTIPTAFDTTGRFTALSTYTDNVLPSSYSVKSTSSPTPSPRSTGKGVVPTVNVGVLVGGIVGAGVFAGV